jgi:hypothetical protein
MDRRSAYGFWELQERGPFSGKRPDLHNQEFAGEMPHVIADKDAGFTPEGSGSCCFGSFDEMATQDNSPDQTGGVLVLFPVVLAGCLVL